MTADSLATLEATSARVAVDDRVELELAHLSLAGERVLLVGDTDALVGALSGVPASDRESARGSEGPAKGVARVASGALSVLGHDVARGHHRLVAAFALADGPLPTLTTVELATRVARLHGVTAREGREKARSWLARVGLGAHEKASCRTLSRAERRALALATAAVTEPAVLVAHHPLEGLEPAEVAFVLQALAACTAERRAMVTARTARPTSAAYALAEGATSAALLGHGRVLASGPPAALLGADTSFTLRVVSGGEALATELTRIGFEVRGEPHRPTVLARGLPPEAASRLGARDVLAAAYRAGATVLEVRPIG